MMTLSLNYISKPRSLIEVIESNSITSSSSISPIDVPQSAQSAQSPKSRCHGMTSLLSFLVFVCPPPHLHHLPTPSNLVRLPSAASAPTLRCTHATVLHPHLD